MKKTMLLIVVLISTMELFSQNYKFNLLTNYKSENGFYKERVVFSNKENGTYFLTIRPFKNQKTAFLIDLKSLYEHQFKVLEGNISGNEITTQFIYLNSYKIKKREDLYKTHSFKVIKQDSVSKTVKMITYLDKRKNKIIDTAELLIKDSPYNLFPVFRFSCLHPYEFHDEFNFNENGMVESYKSFYSKEPINIYLDYYINIKEFEVEVKN